LYSSITSNGDELAFDLVTSSGTDNSTQIVAKSKKPIKANDNAFGQISLAA